MKLFFVYMALILSASSFAQTLFVPSGAGGIGTSLTTNIGIGTNSPRAYFDVGTSSKNQRLASVFARLPEGDATGDGTYLGVRGYASQIEEYSGKSFSIEHRFYGTINSSINFYRGPAITGGYITFTTSNDIERMRIDGSGAIGIGTITIDPAYKLNVNGKIKSEELKVVVDVPADYVFASEYQLMSLSDVARYISNNKHLPNIPSATQLKENGWHVGEMSNKILEKVEELTLYVIEINNEKEKLKEENFKLSEENAKILQRLTALEDRLK